MILFPLMQERGQHEVHAFEGMGSGPVCRVTVGWRCPGIVADFRQGTMYEGATEKARTS